MIDPLEGNLFDLPDYELSLPPPDSPGGNNEATLVNGVQVKTGGNNGPNIATEEPDLFSEILNTKEEYSMVHLLSTILTEEQQQRIERNRQIALERRQAKMQPSSLVQKDEVYVTQPNETNHTPLIQQQDDGITVEVGSVPFEVIGCTQSRSIEEDK